jgi:hypothetical protein
MPGSAAFLKTTDAIRAREVLAFEMVEDRLGSGGYLGAGTAHRAAAACWSGPWM